MTDRIETGEELVQLISEVLQDTGPLGSLTDSEEVVEVLRHARHVRFSSRAQTAAKIVQNTQLPIYHRGLAARLLACTLARAPGPAIAEQIQNTLPVVSAILDTMNKASSGKPYAGALPLTPVDGHRVGINCAAALAQIHDPMAKSTRHTLDVAADNMLMRPYPERNRNLSHRSRPGSPGYMEGSAESSRVGTSGTGFWTGLDRTSTARSLGGTRGSMGTRSSNGYSLASRGHTAMTYGSSSATTEGAYDYQRGIPPEHRPSTQFSDLAGDMGLYDDDIKRQMHVLRMQRQQELNEQDGGDQEPQFGGGSGMLDALSSAMGMIHPNGETAERTEGDGNGTPRVKRRLRNPTATYDDFIRVMLSTPAQGAPSRSFNKPLNPELAELSHSVRNNWEAMPHYLEAIGLLENYPMYAHQQTQKVQRAFQRTRRREMHATALHNKLPEANTGLLFGSDPTGLGTWALRNINAPSALTTNRRKVGLMDSRVLGYTKSMMWYPKPRLVPAGPSESPPKQRGIHGGHSVEAAEEEGGENDRRRDQVSLETWQGRKEPRKMPLFLSLDVTKTNNEFMPWGAERSGERDDFVEDYEEEEVLTERAAEIIEERVARAPMEIQRLDNLVTRVRGQQKGISRLLYANIDQLRLELPIKFLLSLKSSSSFPEFDVQVIRDRAYLMLAAWAEEMRLRAMAAALVPWWQLVVRQRATEYRAGVGVRLLKATLYRMVLRLLLRKFYCWLRWAAWQRHEQREQAAEKLQTVYRGYKGRMEFLELLRRHLAAIPIQTCWRRVWATAEYKIAHARIIVVQRIARGVIVRRIVREWHKSAVPFQSIVRMYPRRVEYLIMADSIVMAQTVYRAWIARKMFYHLFELRIRQFEVFMTMAIVIQRHWRGYPPRQLVKEMRATIARREAAALRIQNWWYRVNDSFASFFLMRLLSVQETTEEQRDERRERQKRLQAVALVQRRSRGWKARKRVTEIKRKGKIASEIQKMYRGRSTRAAFRRYKMDLKAAISIQRFQRRSSYKRNAAARVVQKMYFGNGINIERLHAHVKATKIRMEQERVAEERRKMYRAAMLLQKRIRYVKARNRVKRIRAAIHLQSFFRMCLARMERTKRYLVFCHQAGMELVVIPTLREAMVRATYHVRQRRKYASTIIQTRWRMCAAKKERLARADYLARAIVASVKVQKWWRHRMQVRKRKKMH